MRLMIFLTSLLLTTVSQAASIGAPAPSFALNAISNAAPNAQINLTQYRGKVVYVDFWASWCGPCKKSFPKLDSLRARYGARGFEVIAINLDENIADAKTFLTRTPVSFPIAYDPSGKVAEQYKLKGMPTGYILDRQGVVRHIVVGFNESKDTAAIESTIKRLLGS